MAGIDESGPVAQKSLQATPDAYMQVVGIVQAFAFGYLLTQQAWLGAFIGVPDSGPDAVPKTAFEWSITLFQFVAVFQLIVLTWHVNTQNMMVFERRTGWLDSVIPILFILPEYLMIMTCSWDRIELWWLGVAGFMAMAVLAYLHLFSHVSREFREHNDRIRNALKGYMRTIWIYIFFVGLFAAANYFLKAQPHLFGGVRLADVIADEVVDLVMVAALNALIIGFTAMHVFWFWHSALKVPPAPARTQA